MMTPSLIPKCSKMAAPWLHLLHQKLLLDLIQVKKNTGFPAFQEHKISWLFPDEVSKFHDNYCGNLTPLFSKFFNTLIALCTYRARPWKKTLFLWTRMMYRPTKIPCLFPDLMIWGIFLKFPDFSMKTLTWRKKNLNTHKKILPP